MKFPTGKVAKALRGERGSVAILTGLFMSFMVPGVIAAVDVTNITSTRTQVQSRLDAAVLSASRFDDLAEAYRSGEMQERGETFVLNALKTANIDASNANATFEFDETANRLRGRIEIEAPTLFVGKVVDIDRLVIETELAPKEKIEIEVALSLDVSGSMGWAIDSDTPAPVGSRRIDALRTGVASLTDVFDRNPLVDARVSVIPYSSSVNIGKAKKGMMKNGKAMGSFFDEGGLEIDGDDDDDGGSATTGGSADKMMWATERVERSATGKFKVSKKSPKKGKKVKLKDVGAPKASILPLSDTQSALQHLATVEPEGWTAGHIGAEWALYSLLPDWQDVWNHPGKNPGSMKGDVRKVLVIMTDGDFTMTQTPDLTIDDAYDIFQNVCTEARKEGVTIYTVGLKASARTDAELTECAGSAENYFPVSDATGMTKAFEEIGEKATKTRISG